MGFEWELVAKVYVFERDHDVSAIGTAIHQRRQRSFAVEIRRAVDGAEIDAPPDTVEGGAIADPGDDRRYRSSARRVDPHLAQPVPIRKVGRRGVRSLTPLA